MSNPFDYFDKIVCICSKKETKRWEEVSEIFRKLKIEGRVERYDEIIDSNKLKKEFDSAEFSKTDYCHYKIIENAQKEKLNNIFIFESDVDINEDLDNLDIPISQLEDADWSLFFLGGVPHNVLSVHSEHLLNGTMCQAHSYAVNGEYFDEVLKKISSEKVAIDQVYKRDKKNEIGEKSYFSSRCFFVQKMDEDVPRAELPHRKLISEFKYNSIVKDVIDLYKKNISWVVSHAGTGKLHRMIRSNFVESLKRNKINTTPAHTQIIDIAQNYPKRKLGVIKDQLVKNKICFFSNTNLVFLKNCLDELFSYLNEYDLIIMADGGYLPAYDFQKEILNTNFCLVKPTDYTISLFHPRGYIDEKLKDDRVDISVFNDKLNSKPKYTKHTKIKILDSTEYCMSDNYYKSGNEKIVNFTTEELLGKHPRTIIKSFKQANCWYIENE